VLVILLAAGFLSLSLTSLFVGLAYWVPGHGTFFAITGFISLPLLFMSNAFVPLDAMPGWMEAVARVNPLTYAIESMRIMVIDGWDGDVLIALVALAFASAICLAVGSDQFRRQTRDRVN
jgi:ABC-2 type transport system permease protein